jgi:hypothetical protein
VPQLAQAFKEGRGQRLPFIEEAAHALGVSRFTLRRFCAGKYSNPTAIAAYREFAQKRIAELTGGDAAVVPLAPASPTRRKKKGSKC